MLCGDGTASMCSQRDDLPKPSLRGPGIWAQDRGLCDIERDSFVSQKSMGFCKTPCYLGPVSRP